MAQEAGILVRLASPIKVRFLPHEGATLFKANGRYYLSAADSYEGRYSTCLAISDNVYGPYNTRHEIRTLRWRTGFFKDKLGHWWTSYFGNDSQSPFIEKPAISPD